MSSQIVDFTLLDENTKNLVTNIYPNLHNVKIYLDDLNIIIDIDFDFKDDPECDEYGYVDKKITDFKVGSPTYEALNKIWGVLQERFNHKIK